MTLKRCPRSGASSSNPPSGFKPSFNECFHFDEFHERFDRNFMQKRVSKFRKVYVVMLEGINFAFLSIFQNWGWMDFLKICSLTFYNIIQAFFSNAKLEHDESNDTVIGINSFLTNTPIHLTLEEFGNLLHLPPRGNLNKKRSFNHGYFVQFWLESKVFMIVFSI